MQACTAHHPLLTHSSRCPVEKYKRLQVAIGDGCGTLHGESMLAPRLAAGWLSGYCLRAEILHRSGAILVVPKAGIGVHHAVHRSLERAGFGPGCQRWIITGATIGNEV